MTKAELKKVKQKLTSGYPVGELENDLLQKGYTADEVEKIIYAVSVKNEATTKRYKNVEISMLNLAGVCFIILGIALHAVPTSFEQYGTAILIAGILCVIMKYIIAARKKS